GGRDLRSKGRRFAGSARTVTTQRPSGDGFADEGVHSRQTGGPPMKTRFQPDRGLTSRMVATGFLLGLLYVVFVPVLIPFTRSALLALVPAGGLLFSQYWFSDRIALYAMRGKVVTPQQAPELHGVIDRLCALADMPKPAVAIGDSDMPNAV